MVPGKPTGMTGERPLSGRGTESDEDFEDLDPSQGDDGMDDLTASSATTGDASDGGDLGDRAAQAADTVKQQVNQATSTVQHQATQQLEGGKGRAVSSLDQVAQALQQVGDQLRQNEQAQLGQMANLAAGQVGRLSGYLRNRRVGDLIDDLQDFGRQQPELLLGGAFLLGLVGARFLKASARQASQSSAGGAGMQARSWSGTPETMPPAMGRRAAPYGIYDPGSAGMVVRDVPQ